MPHLYYHKRYWRISNDDLFLPLSCTLIGRLFWLTLIALYFVLDYHHLYICQSGIILLIYLLSTILFLSIIICLDFILIITSLQGNMIQIEKRKLINPLLDIRLLVSYLQAVCALYGIFGVAYTSQIPCNGNEERTIINRAIFIVIICSQYVDVFFLTCCCYLATSSLKSDDDEDDDIEKQNKSNHGIESKSVTERWKKRFEQIIKKIQFYSCNFLGSGNVNQEMENVAKVLTKFFHHEGSLDVVPSDIIAGIIMVRNEQKWRRKRAYRIAKNQTISKINEASDIIMDQPEYKVSDLQSYQHGFKQIATLPQGKLKPIPVNRKDSYIYDLTFLRHLKKYIIYASIIYDRFIVVDEKVNKGNIVSSFCNCFGCMNPNFEGLRINYCYFYGTAIRCTPRGTLKPMNFYGRNKSIIQSEFLESTELIYISFQSDTLHKPYAIFLDHKEEKVVITIRGTLSIEDCITDIECDAMEMEDVGRKWGFDGRGKWAHSGMLRVAETLRLEIDDVLQQIYSGHNESALEVGLKAPLNRGKYNHYQLITTGHSLGAGTAIILTLLLRNSYPHAYCYAFGTPGSVFDYDTCQDSREYCTTVVVGNDIICRLGFRSLCKLRNNILGAIARAKRNKLAIMLSAVTTWKPSELMCEEGNEPTSDFRDQFFKFKTTFEDRLKEPDNVDLYLPGRIIHILKSKVEWVCCWEYPTYDLLEGNADEFTEIPVSRTMITDHSPNEYYEEIAQIEKYRLASNEG